MRKFFVVLLTMLVVGCVPIETKSHGYQAVLWGFSRERVIIQNDVGGNPGLTEYYFKEKVRILCFFVTVEHPEDVRTGVMAIVR